MKLRGVFWSIAIAIALSLLAGLPIHGRANRSATACNLSWATRSAMPTARGYLAAADLPDGRIMAIGGWTVYGPTDVVQIYTPSTDTWQPAASLPMYRNGLGAAVVDGRVYAIGGATVGCTDTVELYDPSSNTWSSRASMPTPRGFLGVVAVNGRVLAIGGRDNDNQSLSTVEEYDPATNTWRSRAAMPTARHGLGVAVGQNGRVYAIGGSTFPGPELSVVEEYDPQTDTWRSRSPMPTPRSGLAVVPSHDGRIYAIGGNHWADGWLATVEVYDPAADSWQTCAGLSVARGALAGAQGAGNSLYALGGAVGSGLEYVSTVEVAIVPVPTPEPVSTVISPSGGILTHRYPGHTTSLEVPPGAVSAPTVFTISYRIPLTATGQLIGMDHFFDLTAEQTVFAVPLTLTVTYSESVRGPIIAETENLYRWQAGQWLTEEITLTSRWREGLSVQISRFSLFAVLGETRRMYLPLVLR